MSQYDDLLNNAPDQTAPTDNPYLTELEDQERVQKQALAATLQSAVQVNPDQYSTQRRVANYLGYPVAAVQAKPDLAAQAQAKQVQQAAASNPVLQKKYTDADFAKLAHDDSTALSSLVDSAIGVAKYIFSAPDSKKTFMGDLAAAAQLADAGAAGAMRAVSEVLAVPFDWMEAETPEQYAGWRGSIGGNPFRRLAEGFGGTANYNLSKAKELSPETGNSTVDAASSGVQSAAQNLMLLPLALLPGGEAAALYGMSGQQGGLSYQNAREAGVGQWQSLAYGASDAVVEYATEKIPLHKLLGDLQSNAGLFKSLLHNAVTEVPGEQGATLLQDLNEWAVMHPDKPFSAYLAERPSAAAQTLIATLIGVGANVGVTHTINRAVQSAMGRQDEVDRAAQTAELFGQMQARINATKLADRSPEHLQDLLHEATDGALARFDAAQLMQTFEQAGLDVSTVLPSIDAKDLLRQAAAGGEVSAPLAEVATAIRGTPLEQSLPEHIRFGSNEMSAAEAKRVQGELKEKFAREMEHAVAQAQDAEAFRQSAEAVRQTLLNQLNKAGRYRSQVNELMSQWAAAFYSTMANRTGVTPEEMYAKYPLRVLSETAQPGSVLNEARTGQLNNIEGYHYSKQARSVISTGAFGTGLEGSGRDTYLNAEDKRLAKRAYFYVDKGTGINPEAGVGGIGHKVTLSNVYDADADPLRLKEGRSQLGFESAVLDSGFGGYLSRMEGTQSGQVIMLGDQTFKPEVLGALGKTNGAVVPKPAARASVGRDQVVDALQAQAKNLPQGSPTRERWAQMLEKVMPKEFAALKDAGVFDGKNDNLYLSELVKEFRAKTEAPVYEQRPASDALQERTAQVSWEATPGASTGVLPGIHEAPMFQQEEYLAAIRKALADENGRDLIDARLGLMTTAGDQLYSGWQGQTSVGVQQRAGVTVENGRVSGQSRLRVQLAADIRGLVLSQEGMAWHFPIYSGAKFGQNGSEFTLGRTLTAEETSALYAALSAELGHSYAPPIPTADGFRVLNFPDEKFALEGETDKGKIKELQRASREKNDAFHEAVLRAVGAQAFNHEVSNVTRFETDGELRENNWANGDADYRKRIGDAAAQLDNDGGTQASDLLKWVDDDLRPRVDAVNKDFAKRYGWDNPHPEQSGVLNQGTAQQHIGDKLADRIDADFEGALAEYNALPETQGGTILNVDLARELSPEYRADRTRAAEVHDAASAFIKRVFAAKLAQPTPTGKLPLVAFMAGGTGAGKSTALSQIPAFSTRAEIILDGTMSNPASADSLIRQALESGREVNYAYVYRDPHDAFVNGALPRAMSEGRTAPLQVLAESHVGARSTVAKLAEKYADHPNVDFVFVDNSRGYGKAAPVALAEIPEVLDNGLKEKLREILQTEFEAGRISEPVYRATRAEPQDTLSEADGAGDRGRAQQAGPQGTSQEVLNQGPRGTFNPQTLELVLTQHADLTTWFHETGHFFLEVMSDIASQPNAPAQIADDMGKLLKWFGVSDLAAWNSMTLDQKRKHHERFAESIEQYVMEGKAPSVELQPAFRRFRAWFLSVYKSIKAFIAAHPDAENMALNNEVRAVFDRMLATDEQIQQANEVAGLMPDPTADTDAAERLQARSMRDLKWAVNARDKVIKKLTREAKSIEKEVRAQVTEEVNQRPEVLAAEALKKAEAEHEASPVSADMNTAVIADAYGFTSIDAMHKAIQDFGDKQAVIDALTERRMLEEHGDLVDERAIQEAANEAVHNEARARSLASELRTQAEMLNPRQDTGRTASNGAKITVNALVEAAKQFGQRVADSTTLKDLKAKVWQHTAAERRAGSAWRDATAKGDTQAAVKAKQDQMLQNAAARATQEALAEAKKTFEFFKRVVKGNDETVVDKGRDPDIVNAARAVLAAYGVETATTKNAAEYLETVKKNDPETYNAIAASVEGALQTAQPLESLTVEQLRSLHEEIQALWFLAKRSRQMEVDGNLMDIADAADELHARMETIGIPDTVPGETSALTPADKRKRWVQFAGALLRRVEQWSEKMDGKFGGPFLRYVFQPVKDAAERYRSDRVQYRKELQAIFDKVAPTFTHKLIEAPELGYTFGKGHNGIGHAELLHAVLHTGNESNLRKLLLGRGWGELLPDGTVDRSRWDGFIARLAKDGTLKPEHFEFAQSIWDLLEKTKPLAQKAHRDVFGRYFAEVTATPFTDPFGVERRGGYVPAQADPMIVPDADIRSLAELENENMAYSFPTTSKGFTKSRVEYNRPLKLDLRTIPQHVDKVLLFSHMEPAVRGVAKLLRNKGVSQALSRIDPSAYSGMLLPWLNRSARQMVETPVAGDGGTARVLSVLRSRAGAALMFGNISNAIQQVTGFSSALVKVGGAHMMRANAQFIAHPKQMIEAVKSQSEFMRNRMDGEIAHMVDTVNGIILDHSLYERAQAWTMRNSHFLQRAIDNTMGPIIWTAAYNQALEQGMDERMAVRFADGTIRQTQQATSPEDVSRFETGRPEARIFTQFYSYFNMLANTNATALQQIASEMGLKKGAGRALGVLFYGVLAPIWVAEAIAQAFKGGPDDKDHDGYLDDWLAAVFGMGTIKGVLAYVPFVGSLANASIGRFTSNPTDDRMSLSPAVGMLESAAGVPADVYNALQGKLNAKQTINDLATLVSIATGLPAKFIARPLGYAAGVEQGKIEPTGPLDAVRGAVTGTASPESKVR